MYRRSIRIDFDAAEHDDINKFLERRKRVQALVEPARKALGLAPAGRDWEMTDGASQILLGAIDKVESNSEAVVSSGRVKIELDEASSAKAEWFIVRPATWQDIDGGSKYMLALRADRVKGREALRRYSENLMVSEAFVSFVKKKGLTGLGFVWIRDTGKYAAPQWYTPIANAFIGRGVDSDWFDPSTRGKYTRDSYLVVQPTRSDGMFGVAEFSAEQLRDRIDGISKPAAQLLARLRKAKTKFGVKISTPVRLLREFLPKTDFAYLRVADVHEKRPMQSVVLCVNARARTALIGARMAKAEDFEAIEVLDKAPKGATVLDRKGAPLPNVPDEKALLEVRKTEKALLAKYQAKPKPAMPVNPPPLAKLLPKLKRRLKSDRQETAEGAAGKAIDAAEKKIKFNLPKRWEELLEAVNGFVIDNCVALDGTAELRVASAENLPEMHRGCRSMIEGQDASLPKTHLGVAESDIGDCIFLDTAKLTKDGDCPMLHIDHETLETVMTWPAIGFFLADALERGEE